MSILNKPRGLFIVLEGMDGSGKSLGTSNFLGYLKEEGLNVIATREIGGTDFGENIRKLIFDRAKPVDPLARLLACLASRQQHVREVIFPNIENGVSVMSDRFYDSTFVYQACVDELKSAYYELSPLRCLSNIFRRPDITLLFKVDAEIAFERGGTRDKLDNDQYKRDLEQAKLVAAGYNLMYAQLSLAQRKNVFVIDGNESIDEVNARLQLIAKDIVFRYKNPS